MYRSRGNSPTLPSAPIGPAPGAAVALPATRVILAYESVETGYGAPPPQRLRAQRAGAGWAQRGNPPPRLRPWPTAGSTAGPARCRAPRVLESSTGPISGIQDQ